MKNSSTQNRPAAPGFVYAAISMVMLVIVGVVALTATQPPPPTIAEFAPQAVEQITDAPSEQTSDFGSGEGGEGPCAPGQEGCAGLATPDPPPGGGRSAVDVPRVRKCVGDPPRQIEDPQSPPCVPYWAGDNGGATHRGVTGNEIKIVVPRSGPMPDGLAEALTAFFNRRFEFYGRQLTLEMFDIADEGDDAQQQADAVRADSMGAFAVVEYGIDIGRGGQRIFYDALASRDIMSTSYTTNYTPEGHVRRRAPYQWQHFPDFHTTQRQAAAFVCRGLKDRPARFGGPGSTGQRRFGIIAEQASGATDYPDVSTLETDMKRCGASVGPVTPVGGFDAGGARNAILQMQTDGVTTVICICNPGSVGLTFMRQATSSGYFPEWMLADYMNTHSDWFAQSTWPSDQAPHAFGITFTNKYNNREDMPWYWATQEASPGYGGPYDWSHYYYVAFLQLASGIQMAGPDLTPETFRTAMLRTRFPNPGAGASPFYQSLVDYSAGDPWQQSDGTVIWWNPTEVSPVTGLRGRFCYANDGRRYTLRTWPTDDSGLFASCN